MKIRVTDKVITELDIFGICDISFDLFLDSKRTTKNHNQNKSKTQTSSPLTSSDLNTNASYSRKKFLIALEASNFELNKALKLKRKPN